MRAVWLRVNDMRHLFGLLLVQEAQMMRLDAAAAAG